MDDTLRPYPFAVPLVEPYEVVIVHLRGQRDDEVESLGAEDAILYVPQLTTQAYCGHKKVPLVMTMQKHS